MVLYAIVLQRLQQVLRELKENIETSALASICTNVNLCILLAFTVSDVIY